MITFTTEYNTAEYSNSSLMSIYCIVRGEDENGKYDSIGDRIVFDLPIEIADFNTLTKEQVDQWVMPTPGYSLLESKVTESINTQNATVLVELPWNIPAPPPPANTVPDAVTPLQIRAAINMMGLREAVESYVLTLDQTSQDAWEYATIIERQNPILVNGAILMGKSEEDLDNLFILASTLT